MINNKKIIDSMEMIRIFTQNGASPNLDEYWDVIVKELSKNIKETEEYLNECDKEKLELISQCFDDIAYNFKDKKFIDILMDLEKKYKGIDISREIEWAKQAIED
ncbi:hypothetical protein [Clostridium sporogenes]|uniref:hypothetical protein n=1 Tax=Clostridium sporogenes TaxID=1509 RepID=UPI002237915A|nr:hypothetical protein [Clostridium sporogenes]MCW6112445.1 hypothetical protein [Clostridium sporogenes]